VIDDDDGHDNNGPGTHVQLATLMEASVDVFLCAGQEVHGLLLRTGEKKPRMHGRHGLDSGSSDACAGPAARPRPGGHRH
jgi:hypothetical protein